MPALTLKARGAAATSNQNQSVTTAANALTNDKNKAVYRAIQQWRYLLYRNGLVQPVVSIHALHGLDLNYSIKPAATRDRSGHYYYPLTIDVIALYQHLLKCQLSLKALLEFGATSAAEPALLEFGDIEQIDRIMTGLALSQEPDSASSLLP